MPQRKLLGGAASTPQQQRQGHKQGSKQRKGLELTGAAKSQQKAEQKLKASAGYRTTLQTRGCCANAATTDSGSTPIAKSKHTIIGPTTSRSINNAEASDVPLWRYVQVKVKRSSGKRKQPAAEGPRGPPPKEIDANGEEVYYVRLCH